MRTSTSGAGIAVVSADDDQLQSLMATADDASNIVSNGAVYHAIADQYGGLRTPPWSTGMRSTTSTTETAGKRIEADLGVAAAFQDTGQFTWGLQATRVNTSRFSGQGVQVAVLDTGMDLAHPDFRGRRFTTQSFIPGQTVQDGHSHGTHCIGTSCGPERPATGVRRYGCAFGANIFAGKVLSDSGSSASGSVVNGINWAVTNRCQVISMSLGADINQVSQAFEIAGQRAWQNGCLIVAAAGNNAGRAAVNFGFVGQPANSPSIMAVAALDSQLRVANFSARSSALTGAAGKVDIAAPGVSIFSSVPVSLERARSSTRAPLRTWRGRREWCQNTRRTGLALWTTVIRMRAVSPAMRATSA